VGVALGGVEQEIVEWGIQVVSLGVAEGGEPVEYGEHHRPRVRGAGGLECGAIDLVGAAENTKVLDEVILERGVVAGQLETVDEEAERRLDVARGGQRPPERDVGGEESVHDAERGGLRGAVGEVGGGADARTGGGSGAAAAEAGGVGVAAGEGGVEVADDAGVQRWGGLGRGGGRQGGFGEPVAAAAPHGRRGSSDFGGWVGGRI